MPIHTLLGATGATGTAVLRCLLEAPPRDLTLKIFVRNKGKLLKSFPDLQSTTAIRVEITEAGFDDGPALQAALDGADVIYMCVGSNTSDPGMTASQEIAAAILAALKTLKQRRSAAYKPSTILVNRSVSLNKTLSKHQTGIVKHVVHFALFHVYDDIEKACDMYSAAADDDHLLDYVYVDAPGLMDQEGKERTGHQLVLEGKMSEGLNYADFGAAFVDIAARKGEFVGKGVGVSATGHVRADVSRLMGYMVWGLKGRIFG